MSLVVSLRVEEGLEHTWASWEGVAVAFEISKSTGSWTRGDGGAEIRDGPAERGKQENAATGLLTRERGRVRRRRRQRESVSRVCTRIRSLLSQMHSPMCPMRFQASLMSRVAAEAV